MTTEPPPDDRPEVVIAGGGIAALEALLALRDLAGDRVAISLVAPEPDFTYRPWAVEEPFTSQPPEHRALAPIAERLDATLHPHAVARVIPDEHVLELDDGSRLHYAVALICIGAQPRPAFKHGITFLAARDRRRLTSLLDDIAADRAQERHLAFVVPPTGTWALPIYELALMTRRRASELGLRELRCTIVTPEPAPLAAFGTVASAAVAELLEVRGIDVIAGVRAREDSAGRIVMTPGGERLDATDLIALPELDGPAVPGLPADERGFIPIDGHARVIGVDDLYAAGDGTTFPIKQGGLATQQADAAAEHIATRFGADLTPERFRPVLRGLLVTGEESLSMRHSPGGGSGEGIVSSDRLWWPPHKVGGRYLAPFLEGTIGGADLEPPSRSLEVEVELPSEWHEEPMALDPHRWHELGRVSHTTRSPQDRD